MKILNKYKNYEPKTVLGIILQKFIFSTKFKLFTGLILLMISAIIIRIISVMIIPNMLIGLCLLVFHQLPMLR